jgi:hypothetical protein
MVDVYVDFSKYVGSYFVYICCLYNFYWVCVEGKGTVTLNFLKTLICFPLINVRHFQVSEQHKLSLFRSY